MIQVLVSELVGEVRVALDENRIENPYLSSVTDNMELDEIIRSKLIEATRTVLENCPIWMLDGEKMPTAVAANTDGTGSISLPDDFLRLVALQMNGWDAPVFFVEPSGTQKALMQKNKWLRGNPKRPVLVFSKNISGARVIEYYSAEGNNAAVELAIYVKIPNVVTSNDKEYLNFPEILKQPIISYCAALVSLVRGNAEQAKSFIQLAESHYS